MWVRHRRRLPTAFAAVVAIAAIAAACSPSRLSTSPSTTDARLGVPVERPDDDTSGSEPLASAGATGAPTGSPDPSPDVAANNSLPAPEPIPLVVPTEAAGTTSVPATIAAVAPAGPLPRPTEAEWMAFDAFLRDQLLDSGDFAFGVAVSIDGEPVHAAAFGDRNAPDMVIPPPESDSTTDPSSSASSTSTTTTTTLPPTPLEPVDTNDRFRVASISKVITGTVVLQLVEDGELDLEQEVGGVLGAALGVDVSGRPVEGITVRQLLSHTSGFNVYQNTFFSRGVETCREAATRGLSEGLAYDPGTTYEYSNMNFCVLGILIEEITGQSYEEAVYQRLLTPLGITGMRLAGTFDPHPDEVVHPSFPDRNYMETLGGAGSWVATPADVVAILDSLDNDKPGFHPLSNAMADLMRAPVSGIEYSNPLDRWYGLATIAFANRSWGHTGTVENTHAMVISRPDGMTWAILVSGNYPQDSDDLADVFQSAIDQSGIDAPAPTTSTTTTTSTTSTSTTSTVPLVPASVTTVTTSA